MINFFNPVCQEPSRNNTSFGICDDSTTKAYTTDVSPESWIAAVSNPDQLDVTFTAIDNCVLLSNEQPGEGRCDGMLTTHTHIYLIELKEAATGWQADAIQQLISTIELILANHDLSAFRKKKAHACNRKRPHFYYIDNELSQEVYQKYKFRLDSQADIVLL